MIDARRDLRRQAPDALVVARLLRQIGKQRSEAIDSQREELAVVRQPQEHLADRECDRLAVRQLGWMARTRTDRQEIADLHVKCSRKGVKGSEHAASKVDVAIATPPFDARLMSPRGHPPAPPNTESTI
jgi:hypothetical protein